MSSSEEAKPMPARPKNANALPGAGLNTAGGDVQPAGIWDVLKSIRPSDFKEVHKKPCVRDSFLVGMGAGFGVGGFRAIMGASVLKACNWAVGTFCFGSFLMHEFCQRKRKLELQQMQRVVEIVEQKKAEKKTQAQAARQTTAPNG